MIVVVRLFIFSFVPLRHSRVRYFSHAQKYADGQKKFDLPSGPDAIGI